ncbi:Domain of unknown function DUF4098 [Ceraceosorus bombacis]|uniref:Uncharacterized protein n=1 Tax=Ceraceosorus bombacis TaxID=401625 RepID=A0A0P1BBL9_9BASI|nr:Domain of unknown function DUF4098 [Ceraceosorus bombacis]
MEEEDADAVPLLSVRSEGQFALDEDTQPMRGDEDAYDSDEAEEQEQGNKYPPRSAPPTYEQALGMLGESSAFASVGAGGGGGGMDNTDNNGRWRNSTSQRFRNCISDLDLRPPTYLLQPVLQGSRAAALKLYSFICRLWPSSRLGQAGLALAGMWILVVFSGPVFEVRDWDQSRGDRDRHRAEWWKGVGDVRVADDLKQAPTAPGPISGDGHIVLPAEWSEPHCALFTYRGYPPYCRTSASFNLSIPDSFAGTASNFVYADPLRLSGMSDGRGRVPGRILVRRARDAREEIRHEDGTPLIGVRVEARYERGSPGLLRGVSVGKMLAGVWGQGVGIYSLPLTHQLRNKFPPPLSFEIRVTLPSGPSALPALKLEAAAMDIDFMHLDELEYDANSRAESASTGSESDKPAQEEWFKAVDTEGIYYGRLQLSSGDGSVRIGSGGALAISHVHARATSGNIAVEGPLIAPAVELHSDNGIVRLGRKAGWSASSSTRPRRRRRGEKAKEESASIKVWKSAVLDTWNGAVVLEKGSAVQGPQLRGTSRNGRIEGEGVWATNGTLLLRSTTGNIDSRVSVLDPLAPRTSSSSSSSAIGSRSIDVRADSLSGSVHLKYIFHAPSIILHSIVSCKSNNVSTTLHRNFFGDWNVRAKRFGVRVKRPPNDGVRGDWISQGRKVGQMEESEKGSLNRAPLLGQGKEQQQQQQQQQQLSGGEVGSAEVSSALGEASIEFA